MKIMESYIGAPDLHADAVKNPKLLGGPFIDYDRERVDDVRALYDGIARCQPEVLELSAAIEQLDSMLRAQARGFCLHEMYDKVPAPLRGFVELVYDRNHNASFRQAWRLAEEFRAREVYVYAMGQEPWITHISSMRYDEASRPIVESNKLLNRCASMSVCAERLFGEKEILLGG